MSTKKRIIATIAVVAGILKLASSVSATLVVGQVQTNAGNVLPSPITAVSNDLLETFVATVSGENASAKVRNGTTGTAAENTTANPAVVWGTANTTYTFNVSTNTLGYDITSINVFSGWGDGRAAQSYRLWYSLVGDTNFYQLGGDIIATFNNASVMTRTYDDTGTPILTGVNAIRFVQFDGPGQYDGVQTVFREFDVVGTATIPEPGTGALVAGGLLVMLLLRRCR